MKSSLCRWVMSVCLLVGCSSTDKPPEGDKTPEQICKQLGEKIKETKESDCLETYRDLEKMNPRGYKCLANCTGLNDKSGIELCHSACTSVNPDLAAQKAVADERAEFGDDEHGFLEWSLIELWMKKPEKSYDATIFDDVHNRRTSLTISLTDELKPPPSEAFVISFDPEVEHGPRFMLETAEGAPKEHMTQAVAALPPEAKVLKQEATDTGYVLHIDNGSYVEVRTGKKVGDVLLLCNGYFSSSSTKKKKALVLPWLEKACTSAKPK